MTRRTYSIQQMIIFISLLLMGMRVTAQTEHQFASGKLIYLQYLQTGQGEVSAYWQTSASGTTVFEVTSDQCASIAPDGQHIAVTAKNPIDLSIYRLSDQTVIQQISWMENWQACNFAWDERGETIFVASSNRVAEIDVVSGRISLRPDSPSGNDTVPLPLKVPDEPIIASDDGRWLLYNQCLELQFADDGSFCEGEAQMVIYDAVNRTVVQSLTDTNFTILGGPIDAFPPKLPAAFWSPSGRYLLYYLTDTTTPSPFRIFDVVERRRIEVSIPVGYRANPFFAAFQWSSDENLVGFWLNSSDPLDAGDSFYFGNFSLEAETLDVTTRRYSFSQQWRWSPDNAAIAFINGDSELIMISLEDEQASLIDDGVYSIIAWTP